MSYPTTLPARFASQVSRPYLQMPLLELGHEIALGWRLLESADTAILARSLAELGELDLPPVTVAVANRTVLQAIIPLYMAAELEEARVIPLVETIAALAATGGLRGDVGVASTQLVNFWRTRSRRFTASERSALFSRLFGMHSEALLAGDDAQNRVFESLFIDLAEAIYKTEPSHLPGSRVVAQMPVRLAATQLIANLAARGHGMTTFAGRELMQTVEDALAILKQPNVQQALGGASLWAAVTVGVRRYLREDIDVASHVVRARSGTQILAWLIGVLPQLDDPASDLLTPEHPIIADAAAWLQASLALAERVPVSARGAVRYA